MNLVSMLRFGEMERDCFCGETKISLSEGVSVFIKDMKDKHFNVLGFSEKDNGLISSVQSDFLYKGKKECLKITLEDGRTIECTDNHKLLDVNNKWTEAKNIIINDTKLKVGIMNPYVDFEKDMVECNNWSIKFGDLELKTSSYEEFRKSLAFCRFLGYLIMDGTVSDSRANINLGHLLDVHSLLEDLKLFQNIDNIKPKLCSKNHYEINISTTFLKDILKIDGVIIGKKVNQESVLPTFILDESCPKPLVREFIAGMFGGDGHTCVLGMHRGKRDTITPVAFSKSRKHNYTNSLVKMMNDIKNLLSKRFNINNVSIQNLKETSHSKKYYKNIVDKCYQSTLLIQVKDLNLFTEQIGFRYCCHKSQRLSAGNSYHEYKKINKDYVIAEDYIKNIGVLDWFIKNKNNVNSMGYGVEREKISLPTMNLKIIKIENIGEKDVYDIQVDDTHSFLANGVVAHNCMISHGTSKFLKERLFEKSDPYQINVCDTCGNIATTSTECKACNNDKITKCNFPYASKLLVNELQAMNIKVSLKVKK